VRHADTPSFAARIALAAALAAMATGALTGHVLDQVVQATRLQIAADAVTVDLDLTPGIELAPALFAAINGDRDGVISASEGRAHAAQVLADLVLDVDGRRLTLALVSADYPAFEAMRGGVGTIRLRAVAPLSTAAGGHRLHYQNNHRQDVSVYLVNALEPTEPGIALAAPRRDRRQQSFDVDFTQDRASASHGAWTTWRWASAIGLAIAFGVRHWRRRQPAARL
jgi:hypothetical protein